MTDSSKRVSVLDLTFGLWALLVPLAASGRLLNGDGDLARHLVIGEHIMSEGPRFADPFSFTRPGEPFLAYEWLSQVLLHLAHRLGGLPGVAVLAGLVIASAVTLVVHYVRRRGGDPWLAYMTGTLAAILTGPHWIARPHLFSLLALPVLVLLLHRERPSLPAVAVLFALWANLHPGFLYGLVLLAVVQVGRLMEAGVAGRLTRGLVGRAAATVAVALLASFANPFGWELHVHALTHAANAELLGAVDEFEPLAPASAYGVLVMLTVGAVFLGLSAHRERVRFDVLGVFLMGLFATVAAKRNGPLLAVSGLPMTARALAPAVTLLPAWFAGRMRAEFRRSDGSSRWASGGALAILTVVVATRGGIGPVTLVPDRFSGEEFPVEAVERARDAGLSGRLLSEYTWGGYVLFSWPEQRIFVDSMADFFGPELVARYSMMRDAGPEWSRLLDAYDISLALLSHEAPLVARLRRDPEWRVWYEDGTAVLFRHEPAAGY